MHTKTYLETIRLDAGNVDSEREGAWQCDLAACVSQSPFMSRAWSESWLSAYSDDVTITLLALSDAADRTLGIAILPARRAKVGPFSVSRLHFHTSGENDADSAFVEHVEPLCEPEAIRSLLLATRKHAESLSVDQFLVSGASEQTLAQFSSAFADWSLEVEWRPAPYVNLRRLRSESIGHLQALSSNSRSKLRRTLKYYGGYSSLSISFPTSATEATQYLSELQHLHQLSWEMKGGSGAFASPRRAAFMQRLVRYGFASGDAQIMKIQRGQEAIGLLLLLLSGSRVCFYQSGITRPTTSSDARPGLLAHHLAIEYYLGAGFDEYDFLASGEKDVRYKRSLSNSERMLGWAVFSRPSTKTNAIRLARSLKRLFSGAKVNFEFWSGVKK